MAITLAELMKGRSALKEEELSSKAGGMESIAKAIEQGLASNPNITRVSSSVTETTTESKVQDALLKEQKKTNSLLGEMIQFEKKYFEDNKELISRLLISQEQMLERKSTTVEAIAKTTEDKKETDKGVSRGDLASGALALGPLVAILASSLPEIVKTLRENFPKLFDKVDSFLGSAKEAADKFMSQSAPARDVERIGLNMGGMAAARLAERNVDRLIAEQAAKDAEKAAAKALFRQTEREVGEDAAKVAAASVAKRAMFDQNMVYTSESGKKLTENAAGKVVDAETRKFASKEAAGEFRAAKSTAAAQAPTIEEALSKKVGAEAAEDVMKIGKGGAKQFIAENLSKAKGAAKIGAAKLAKGMVAKSIPLVGAVIGTIDAGYRALEGDYSGAAISFGSGVASNPFTSTAGLMALLAHDVYKGVYGSSYASDVMKDPDAANEKLKELGPIVYDALKEELHDAFKPTLEPGETVSTMGQGYRKPVYPTGKVKPNDESGTGRREAPDVTPSVTGGAAASPITAAPRPTPAIDGTQTGTTIINDNKTINNIDNSKAGGGGGSGSGFPNSSTAPRNPWDGPLYGDNMYYF